MSAPVMRDGPPPSGSSVEERVARRVILTGQVQGIGLRPAIARWATELGLAGQVCNSTRGVEIDVEGPPLLVERFLEQLPACIPPGGSLGELHVSVAPCRGRRGWRIEPPCDAGTLTTPVPRDRATCNLCQAEVAETADPRRGGYAFTSCTQCGPRYSVLDRLPFARERTTWAQFAMCPDCRREFEQADNRRFHAELNGCARCGPRVRLVDRQGQPWSTAWRPAVRQALEQGQTIALLGVGGYQLLCDATNPAAIAAVRRRKVRPTKPLAVLVQDLAMAHRLALVDATEASALADPTNPIVIVRCRENAALARAELQPGLREVGLLLPTTPLHWLVARDFGRPLVCTSANREGEPLWYRTFGEGEPRPDLAELWLEHDRPVAQPIDDSVVRVIAGRVVTLRLARGLAPLPLELPPRLLQAPSTLATGGQQKVALAWSNGSQAALGAHVGDLDTLASFQRWEQRLDACRQLYRLTPLCYAGDLHPDYATTRWLQSQSTATCHVQHHHAHVASVLVAHHRWQQTVMGVAWDGTGWGPDGTVWGGEFLSASLAGYRRVASLRTIPLLGGAAAVRQPARVALALLHAALDEVPYELRPAGMDPQIARSWASLLNRPHATALASSAGRLFDGVAALALADAGHHEEGRLAMLLESIADDSATGEYPLPLCRARRPAPDELDWRPLVGAVWSDVCRGVSPGVISMRFHRALARGICAVADRYPRCPVALSGGVFQNRLLTELVVEYFAAKNEQHRLLLPGLIPPNDGGLAAGQLAVSLAAGCGHSAKHWTNGE